ncbi:MAG: hypothetical protein FWG50_05135 [Kiritimatiellaeota bacterium]|nr:hypothetical protein [Kiritimatiellota bacterium]
MKHLLLTTVLAAGLLACASHAQETAAQWADKNVAALKAAVEPAALAAHVKQGQPAYDALFAQIKTGGESDAIASVTVAALSQFVMTQPKAARKAYADALLAAAQKATAPDVTCVFLDQLRWCGLPEQAKAIAAFTKSADASVAELAAITAYAVADDRAVKLKPPAPSSCLSFNQEMAKLSASARTKRLMEAFDGADNGVAGAALVWMNEKGNVEKTADWAAKLAAVADPVRRVMLIDALAIRGDKSAFDAIFACAADADALVVKAALAALLQLDATGFVTRFTGTLKTIDGGKVGAWRDAARQVPTATLIKPLLASYATFNDEGKKLALDLFRERRTADAMIPALAATDSADENMAIAGYRALRDAGTVQNAGAILMRLPKTAGRVAPEAQAAFAAIAKRDTTDTTVGLLRKTLLSMPEAERGNLYETAARIGGKQLLDDVEKAATAADANLAGTGIRALSAWVDTDSVPTLMRLALTSADEKNRTLALRGVQQKLSAKNIDKNPLREQWNKIRETEGNADNKAAIDELFK